MIDLLLDHGEDINAIDENGMTSLDYAIKMDTGEIKNSSGEFVTGDLGGLINHLVFEGGKKSSEL